MSKEFVKYKKILNKQKIYLYFWLEIPHYEWLKIYSSVCLVNGCTISAFVTTGGCVTITPISVWWDFSSWFHLSTDILTWNNEHYHRNEEKDNIEKASKSYRIVDSKNQEVNERVTNPAFNIFILLNIILGNHSISEEIRKTAKE